MTTQKNKMETIDILKINHFLNVRKITTKVLKKEIISLYKKINTRKNFKISSSEVNYLNSKLSIPIEKIKFQKKLPDYILWNKKKILGSKRAINRDGIHFYNYYSLPTPHGFIGPVILDILCPKNKLPKLNNGHLEQAITVNLGSDDIYGRWGVKKKKFNFSKIKFNSSKKNKWIIGDTYVEPSYCPHSYSRVNNNNSQILSYTAKSPIEKLVKNLNSWSNENYKNFYSKVNSSDNRILILKYYLDNRGVSLKYLSRTLGIKIINLKQVFINQKTLRKVCSFLRLDLSIFYNNKNLDEDKIGKTYLSYEDSFKTIRKFKSYLMASMAFSHRYPDLFGCFIKVSNKKNLLDLSNYAASHYLVTSGNLKFNIRNKRVDIKKGDAIWVSSFKNHGFSGNGSLLKISNGESLDTSNLHEILKMYKPKKTISRSYKDKITWGYD